MITEDDFNIRPGHTPRPSTTVKIYHSTFKGIMPDALSPKWKLPSDIRDASHRT